MSDLRNARLDEGSNVSTDTLQNGAGLTGSCYSLTTRGTSSILMTLEWDVKAMWSHSYGLLVYDLI